MNQRASSDGGGDDNASLDLTALAGRYDAGQQRPTDVVDELWARIDRRGSDGVWITLAARDQLMAAARAVQERRARGERLPLYGVPFAVKDNIDVAGLPTTAACPAFATTPTADAAVVGRLVAAGAIPFGKVNLDQFATGLVGVRSPYGIPPNTFDARLTPGGSSSGSAVAVAAGLVSFALGTDTAGSGRVPAAYNNIVGIKPSPGLLSTRGVVPACRSFDCVSIFSLTAADGARIAEMARGYDAADAFSRPEADDLTLSLQAPPARFRFGIVSDAQLDFCGDEKSRAAWQATVATLVGLGGEPVAIDFAPFREAGSLLYGGPFIAERLEATADLLAHHPDRLLPTIRTLLQQAARHDANHAFQAVQRLRLLRRQADAVLRAIDFLAVPTAPTIYTLAQIEAEPLRLNFTLGTYTTFVNLLDLAAVAAPAGLRSDGLPFGATLIAPWGHDARLAGFADHLHRASTTFLGATRNRLDATPTVPTGGAPNSYGDWLPIAVVGAHLQGQPLNHQLTNAGGVLLRACKTAPTYRLFALPNTTPPKPGLVRVDDSAGVAIDVEVWALPRAAFGAFVARVPAPLAIGQLELADGTRVSGFLCEAHATQGARDISSFGGWRQFQGAGSPI